MVAKHGFVTVLNQFPLSIKTYWYHNKILRMVFYDLVSFAEHRLFVATCRVVCEIKMAGLKWRCGMRAQWGGE